VMSPFLSFSFRLHGATSLLQRFLLPLVAAVALASYPSYKLRVHVRAKAGGGGGGGITFMLYVLTFLRVDLADAAPRFRGLLAALKTS
jgi:hypothetical protein